jgi:hypothetical protein
MRRLVLLAMCVTVGAAGAWGLVRAVQGSSPVSGSAAPTEPARPVRLDALIADDASASVRFSAVLTEQTLKWQLTNPIKVTRASLRVDTAGQPIPLCASCGATELGTLSLSVQDARTASAGMAELSVETEIGGLARAKVRAAPCTCAAGLSFPPPSSSSQ